MGLSTCKETLVSPVLPGPHHMHFKYSSLIVMIKLQQINSSGANPWLWFYLAASLTPGMNLEGIAQQFLNCPSC